MADLSERKLIMRSFTGKCCLTVAALAAIILVAGEARADPASDAAAQRAAAAAKAQQAAINKRNADAAAARAATLRKQPTEQPKQIIPKTSAKSQLDEAAKGPGQAAKVFDGGR